MLINGIELSTFGAELYDRVIKSNSIYTSQEWLDGDIQPTFIRQQDKFKRIELQFLILGNDEEDAFLRMSRLTQALKKSSLKFDDINLVFDTTLVKAAEPKRLKNGNFIVSYTLTSDYAKGEREIYTTDASATNSFKLTLLYYKNSTELIKMESITLRAGQFKPDGTSFSELGINPNKYLPEYFNDGVITNIGSLEITFDNLRALGTLIINYEPVRYNIQANYYMDNGAGVFQEIIRVQHSFTKAKLDSCRSIGELIDVAQYRPEGYKATIDYDGSLELESILAHGTFNVFYRKIENELSKNIILHYQKENDSGEFEEFYNTVINVKESDVYDGIQLKNILYVDSQRPNAKYYEAGYIVDFNLNDLVSFEELEAEYTIKYALLTNSVFVEYYAGIYPNWYRISTNTINTKYDTSYDISFDISTLVDLNRFKTSEYQNGQIQNVSIYETYDDFLNAGVIQVYYVPIDYPIEVYFYKKDSEDPPVKVDLTINATNFFNEPTLTEILPINENRPEGYQFDRENSYSGEVSLSALTQASPIIIMFEEIQANRTKNIILRYKKELSSAFSTVNTSLITINEADCIGGVRLKDIFNLNAYKPEYYEDGVIDGFSSTAVIEFQNLESEYNILYIATFYNTPVRYYTDEVLDINWIGSDNLTYRVFDFSTGTTLYDLGLDLNAFKPSYCGPGQLQYHGPVSFEALRGLTSVDIVYTITETPPEDDDIDYPHRFLFLQHNDLGSYENLHPTWTMNHAYINTGVSAADMSKLTVIMECKRVDPDVPLSDVNVGRAYLFGSTEGQAKFCMGFDNQTKYGTGLTGVNLYFAQAGRNTNEYTATEEAAVGFSENSGIYASDRDGYSYATFTYTNSLQSEVARMNYPLYLFANNNAGSYQGGLAGIGIYGCRIYYDNQLIRDFIPVQFYDKIGDQVAPSNCLYDKITKTFFEDETGMKSFNIIDDDRYVDINPEHHIGHCFVNFYKGTEQFQSTMIMFRESDFINQTWDPYEKFNIDYYQPAYYKPGVIQNYENLVFDFEHVNNSIYSVVYEQDATSFVVNYWQVDGEVRTLLATENIPINEQTFYQVPTFGDIVRLNKYKPEGYKTDFVYPDNKVSLARILSHAPYDIEYVQETEPLQTYSTTIRYIKKIFGIRTYQTIGTQTLTFDQTNFRDGEYIDFYIDMNLYKPERFYLDGEPYQWYLFDDRLDDPSKLKEEYIIAYMPSVENIQIDYYVESVDEENLIANTTWNVKIDEFINDDTFYVVDLIPNHYINDYKPGYCNGGILQDSSTEYTFEELVDTGIKIVYPRKTQPHDPEGEDFIPKVLVYGPIDNSSKSELGGAGDRAGWGDIYGKIPYIDLGYTPKELSRLRVEMTCFAGSSGIITTGSEHVFTHPGISHGGDTIEGEDAAYDGTYFFGYHGAYFPMYHGINGRVRSVGTLASVETGINEGTLDYEGRLSGISPDSYGQFAIRCRVPMASMWVYTSVDPYLYDDHDYRKYSQQIIRPGIVCSYRKGKEWMTDDNFEFIRCHANHQFGSWWNFVDPWNQYSELKTEGLMKTWYNEHQNLCLANPWNIVFDAYHGYTSISSYIDSNTPTVWNWGHQMDNEIDIWEGLERPKAPITVFQTTNPYTGLVNIDPIYSESMILPNASTPSFPSNLIGLALTYGVDSEEYKKAATKEVWIDTGKVDENNRPILEKGYETVNIKYMQYRLPEFPQLGHVLIWNIKIYDRDRLVRDLIPVGKGDKVYDYTMPDVGLFDLQTEIFFGNKNFGGHYTGYGFLSNADRGTGVPSYQEVDIAPEDVFPLTCYEDLLSYGQIQTNYYDYNNEYIDSKYVNVPTYFSTKNDTIEDILHYDDFKPDDFHLNGFLDIDKDLTFENLSLAELYEMNTANVYYKLRTFTKTVVYYQDNVRIGSKDIFYSLLDLQGAETLSDLGLDLDLYYNENFAHGRLVFNEDSISDDDMRAFIDAPSPIVVYDKLSKQDAPNLFYVEYYRGGAYDDSLITLNSEDNNYLDCNLTAVVLNPNGAIKYNNHYHSALYEDEKFDYFIPYQVKVVNKYAGIHYGPARKYKTLAMVIDDDYLTIIDERNGWGKLKEYRNGWVLLNQFEPVSGPGQNPDYDIHDEYTAILPFGERVNITKMTIDRLWCYNPDSESWIKAEDLSYDQAGKLYNGLKMEVIDLSELDFTNITSLTDMGINTEAWKLRFHDNSNYTYTGQYTLEAFQNLHEIDIVYPETIYNYTCIYYKDNIDNPSELGRSAFSCSISDWNPDWDKFIETSWQTKKEYHSLSGTFSKVYFIDENTQSIIKSQDLGYSQITLSDETFYEHLEINEKHYYKISGKRYVINSLSGQYDYYWVQAPSSYWENKTEQIIPVDPTLYRDTELTLNWDYFGFNRNLYKPNGYFDGIYLWNPRAWDQDNINFTFNELITCGTQKVFYPSFDVNKYKIRVGKANFRAIDYGGLGYEVNFETNGLPFPLIPSGTNNYSVYYQGEVYKKFDEYWNTSRRNFSAPGLAMPQTIWYEYLGQDSRDYSNGLQGILPSIYNKDTNFTFTYSYSNEKYSRGMFGFKDLNSSSPFTFYPISRSSSEWQPLNETTNINNLDNFYWQGKDFTGGSESKKAGPYYNVPKTTLSPGSVAYSVITYINNEISHYYIPVPKGMWYSYNNINKQISENGIFDLLNDKLYTSHARQKDVIYLRNQEVEVADEYDFFDGWDYESSDCNYIIQLLEDKISYKDPDIYSIEKRNLINELILPITKYTSDQANHIQGEWYKSCDQWFKSQNTQIYAGEYFNPNKLVSKYEKITLIPLASSPVAFKAYSAPYRIVYYDETIEPIGYDFNSIQWDDGYINSSGSEQSNSDFHRSNYISVFGDGGILKITIDATGKSSSGSDNCRILTYDENKTFINNNSIQVSTSGIYSIRAVIDSNIKYIRFSWPKYVEPTNWEVVDNEPKETFYKSSYGTSPQVLQSFYYYEDRDNKFFFDGQYWIPWIYTDQNNIEHNLNYAIVNRIPYYTYPIEDLEYVAGYYQYGDRITVLYVNANDEAWGYTGQGWIRLGADTSLVE